MIDDLSRQPVCLAMIPVVTFVVPRSGGSPSASRQDSGSLSVLRFDDDGAAILVRLEAPGAMVTVGCRTAVAELDVVIMSSISTDGALPSFRSREVGDGGRF